MSSAGDPDIGASTPSLARLSAVPAPGEQQHLALRPAPQDQGKTHSSNGAARPLSDPPADAEVLRYRADLARVRSFAAAWAARAGLPPHRVGDLVISVGELTANTLAHTDEPGQLTLWATGSEVICQVHDIGQITDPQAGKLRQIRATPPGAVACGSCTSSAIWWRSARGQRAPQPACTCSSGPRWPL